MTATKERKILLKSEPQCVEGVLVDVVPNERSYSLVFETGEEIRMPKDNYTVPFDLYEGMRLRAEWKQEPGWTKKKFDMVSLEDEEEAIPFA